MRPLTNYFLHSKEHNLIIKGEAIREDVVSYSSNRSIKDTVFRFLMDDEKNLLSLFNALEGTDYQDQELIHINTLKGAIFDKKRNDLSFSVADWFLTIVEHQSSVTENAPLRMSVYLARVWEQVLELARAYRRKLYKIPLPRLYVLYNGTEPFPQEKIYRLSDAFSMSKGIPQVELAVCTININLEADHPILEKCPILKEYSIFIYCIRKKLKQGKNRDIAVKEAIRECVKDGVLEQFLYRHGREVYNMIFDEITYEDILQIRLEEAKEDAIEQGLEQGLERGLEQGMEKGIAGFIAGFCEEGFSQDKILDKLQAHFDLTREAAQQYYKEYAH